MSCYTFSLTHFPSLSSFPFPPCPAMTLPYLKWHYCPSVMAQWRLIPLYVPGWLLSTQVNMKMSVWFTWWSICRKVAVFTFMVIFLQIEDSYIIELQWSKINHFHAFLFLKSLKVSLKLSIITENGKLQIHPPLCSVQKKQHQHFHCVLCTFSVHCVVFTDFPKRSQSPAHQCQLTREQVEVMIHHTVTLQFII